MQFRPSALSNPNLQRVAITQLPIDPSVQKSRLPSGRSFQRVAGGPAPSPVRHSQAADPIIANITGDEDEEEEKEEAEGLSMPVKVALGVGVAGALGFLVYSLIK
jgi:hypothetical protein